MPGALLPVSSILLIFYPEVKVASFVKKSVLEHQQFLSDILAESSHVNANILPCGLHEGLSNNFLTFTLPLLVMHDLNT